MFILEIEEVIEKFLLILMREIRMKRKIEVCISSEDEFCELDLE